MVAENEEILSYPESDFCVNPMFLFMIYYVKFMVLKIYKYSKNVSVFDLQAVMPMPAATGRMVTPTSMPMVPTSHGAQSSQSHQHSIFSKKYIIALN